jgi:N-dimethylarginine dimethylaminohydrolase
LQQRGLVDSVHSMPAGVYFEGAGDAIWDATRAMFWLGYGQRSSFEARDTIAAVFGQSAISLRLIDPRFYHLDTCFCPLSGGEILYYPAAFDEASIKLIEAVAGDRLIVASDDDANHLGVNSVCLGKDVVMGYCSAPLRTQLQQRGYTVRVVDLGSFNRSGGSAYCLTLRLDNRSSSMA